MSFNTNTGRAEYTASAGQTLFSFVFKVFNDTDLKVYKTLANAIPNETNDLLILNADYTVTIDGDAGGSITLLSSAFTDDAITLLRDLSTTREIEYQTSGDLLAETLNDDQEYQTYLLADNKQVSERTLVFEKNLQGIDNTLPTPQALKILRWRADERALENASIVDDGVFVNIFNVSTMEDILTTSYTAYSTVNVRGYHSENDSGGGLFNWNSSMNKSNANAGTIIDPSVSLANQGTGVGTGCWIRQYSGSIDVRWFGAKGDGITNDYDAIKNAIIASNGKTLIFEHTDNSYLIDGAGSLIVVSETDLPNGIIIDFNNQEILWKGTRLTDGSQGTQHSTNWGVFTFRGSNGSTSTHTLTSELTAPISSLPEPSSHGLSEGDIVFVESTISGGGTGEFKDHIVNRTMRLDKIDSGNFFFDSRIEFTITNGSEIKYTKINPVENIIIKNLDNFIDDSAYDTVNKNNGASCIVFENCNKCSADKVSSVGTPEHTVSVVKSHLINIENGELLFPKETASGGYYSQLLQSSHIICRNIQGAQERHIIDVTASAHISIESSGSNSTSNATFSSHGAYEHDISYKDCFGYLSLSNSGETFGSSTRFVNIQNHAGTNLNLGQNSYQGVSDISVNNSRFIGISYLNLDGINLDNVSFGQKLHFAQNSQRSLSDNILEHSYIPDLAVDSLSTTNPNVGTPVSTAKVKFISSTIKYLGAFTINAGGEHEFLDCNVTYSGTSNINVPIFFQGGSLKSLTSGGGTTSIVCTSNFKEIGTEMDRFGMTFEGTTDQIIEFNGGSIRMSDSVATTPWQGTKTSGILHLMINGVDVDKETVADRLFTFLTSGATLQLNVNGNQFKNCDIRLDAGLWASGKNALIYTNNAEDTVTITSRPTTGSNAIVANNLNV